MPAGAQPTDERYDDQFEVKGGAVNRNAGTWIVAAAVLVLVALGIEGLTIQRIGIGPISIDFAANGGSQPILSAEPKPKPEPKPEPNPEPNQSSNGNGQETPVVVPDVVGRTKRAAADALARANLQASFVAVDSNTPVDRVVRTTPSAGGRVEPGSDVQVEISRGPFAGIWVNSDPNTRNVPQVTIETTSATTANVHVWGACTPTWCDWGTTTASLSSGAFQASYNPGFAVKQLSISRSGEQLVVKIHTHFTDNSGRADYDSTNIMNRK